MITVDNFDYKNQKVIIRVDFNVPLNEHLEITDDTRIRAAIPTLKKVLSDNGSLIIMSHLGRPKNGPEEKFSLKPIQDHLAKLLNTKVKFAKDCIGKDAIKLAQELVNGEVLLLENLRFYKEETKGDDKFAHKLAALADYYVNDAFGTAHRAHASTAIIAKFFGGRKAFGYLMAAEIENATTVLKNAQKPFTAVIGGAKVSSKISIINNLLDKIDNLIIGGGMAYTFAKAQGGTIGNSLIEDDYINTAREVLTKAEKLGVRILLPEDTVAANKFSNDSERKTFDTNAIDDGWMGMDIGPKAIEKNKTCLEESKTILWNGPMGVFEMENFSEGTKQVAFGVVSGTERGAYSLIGGGDSVAAINKFNLKEHVSYVSTGGGALLELIEGKELPGIKAMLN